MEHHEAQKTMAAERYLLGEMTGAERDLFEAHFFDCPECAADIRDGMRLMAGGRDVAREAVPAPLPFRPKSRLSGWMPQAAAAAVVSAALGWWGAVQTVVPRMAAAPAIEMFETQTEIDTELERGPDGTMVKQVPERGVVNVTISSPEDAESYVVGFRDAGGRVLSEWPLTHQQAEDSKTFVYRALPRGTRVVIEGVRKDGNRFLIAETKLNVVEKREEGSP